MKRWKMVSLVCLGTLLLLAGFVAFVLPGILKSEAVRRVEAATGRGLGIGGVSINPFTFTLTVRQVRLTERGSGETFAALSSARIAVSPASLYRRAPVIAAAQLSAPYLRIVRVGANRYNFSDLLKFLPLHPRLSVSNLTVKNGSLDFLDRGLPVPRRHELRKVELAVPFITTMPLYADRYVSPRLSAVLNGAPIHLEGRLRPFPRAVEASGSVEFQDASLPHYLAYLPVPLPVRVESGRVSSKLALSYRVARRENPELSLSGSLTLDDLKVADRTGGPLLAVRRLDAGIDRVRLPSGDFDLSSLSADGLEVFLTRDQQGVWSHRRLLPSASPGAASHHKPLASVKRVRLSNGRLHFRDSLGGFSTDLADISLDLQGFSTGPEKRAGYALSFTTARGEQADLKGDFSPNPWAVSSTFQLSGVPLEAYYPYLAWAERSEVKGRFRGEGKLSYDRALGLRLAELSVQARPFTTLVGGKARISGSSLSLVGGSYSRKDHLVQVADAGLKGGELRFSRLRKGGLRVLATARALQQVEMRKKSGAVPLRYRIEHLTGTGMNAFFTDEKPPAQPSFALDRFDFSLEQLAGPHFGPTPFSVSAGYGKKGSLSASGSVSQTPPGVQGKLAVQDLPLADFKPYLPEKFNLTVADGRVAARLAGSLARAERGLTGSYGGSVGVHSLRFLDPGGDELLSAENLQVEKFKLNLVPSVLDIGALVLTRFHSLIVVAKDGSLNIQQLKSRKPVGKTEQETAVVAKDHLVRVGEVTLQDGTLAFADHHVMGGYSTTLFNLGGRVSGLSSEENRLADLDLRGNLENQSPLRITGRINPLSRDLYADLTVSFTGIELPPMTPYSGTYLGYAVDRGKLFLDSRYRIVNRKLDSENHVFIDQLDLGKSIPSDKATALPVRLAVALFKDRKGEIRLDLPVMGQTDDPKFDLWSVVLKALKGLVVKAATSPFALFQAMFGAKEDPSSVGFAPGSATLSRVEREKLLKLATALNDRPALQLKVTGFVDRERDYEGYRDELLLKKMRGEKFLALVRDKKNKPGDSPESLRIDAGEYARYLKAVYDKEQFPKPRNLLGQVKALPDSEMKKLILAHTVVGEQQMRSLADARAAGVRAFLVGEGGVAAARVRQRSGDMYRASAQGAVPGSRVELEIAVE